MTTNCRLYSNISQILLLYKTWGNYNKFDSMKSLGVCYWYVKIPQCGYMGHALQLIRFYVKKRIAALGGCHNLPLVHDTPLGAPASVKLVYWLLLGLLYYPGTLWPMLCTAQLPGPVLKAFGRVQISPFQLADKPPMITDQHTAGGSVSQLGQLTKLSPWLTLSTKDITTSFWHYKKWFCFFI